jgi:hypothetical protein
MKALLQQHMRRAPPPLALRAPARSSQRAAMRASAA